ncbi:DctQ TRAP-type C4-dicarboxylate transport system, large permease component [Burkholderiaceae bacterium]|jgi:tripartite ATP-independent transporter DctM subunit
MIWAFLGGVLGLTVMSGAVLGAALGLTGFAILEIFGGGVTRLGVQAVFNVLAEFTLTAIPLFILLGDVLVASGLATGIYKAMSPLFGRLRGGLLHTNIAVCTVFGAVSGSSMSVSAAVGSVAYPELSQRGYDRRLVVGSLAGGGTLGLLIPPSLSLLIYGALTDTSIGKLFLAGVLPGLMMAALFMVYIEITVRRQPSLAPQEPRMPWGETLRATMAVWPILVLILAVLGSLFAGIATPTESAAVGVAAAVLLGFTMGDLTWPKLAKTFLSSASTFAVIALVFMGAVILAQSISLMQLPQKMLETISGVGMSPLVLLVVIVFIYLLLGMIFDGLSMMVMTLPVVFPLMTGLGFDAIWLGVVITMMVEIGMLTPPVGMNLFVLVGITQGKVTLAEAAMGALPFWILLMVGVAILTVVPGIATWLPSVAL